VLSRDTRSCEDRDASPSTLHYLNAGIGAWTGRTCCRVSADQVLVCTNFCLWLGVSTQTPLSTRVWHRRFAKHATRCKESLPAPQPWTSIPSNTNNGPALFGDLLSTRLAQSQLYARLQEKIRRDPGESPTRVLDWYQERLKESRSRLLKGSADSYSSNLLLINYAAQQHDVCTLQRLRPSAQLWSQRCKHDVSAGKMESHVGSTVTLTEKIDGILFVLAAKQGNWQVMYKLATSRHPRKRWTPQMCLAMLRSRGALDMITSIQHNENPPKFGLGAGNDNDTPGNNDVVAKQLLWTMFLREFGRYMQKAKVPSTSAKVSLPSWVIAALLDLYAKSGKVESTLDLVWSHLRMHKSKDYSSRQGTTRILRGAPSRLLSSPNSLIRGPRILHFILRALRVHGNPEAVLQAFAILTRTDLGCQRESNLSHPLLRQNRILFEPDNNTILLVMDTMVKAEPQAKDLPEKLLAFLRSVDRAWGSWRARMDSFWHPMFLDLRPMRQLLNLCLEMDAYRIVRQVLRFQQGLLRRELKWHQSSHKKRIWRQGPNELTMLRDWADTLAALCRRHWILDDQAKSLYYMASRLTRLYRYRQRTRHSSCQAPQLSE